MLQSFTKGLGIQRVALMKGATGTTHAASAVVVAAGSSIGAYTATPVELIASTAFDATRVRVWNVATCGNSNLRSDVKADLMVGPPGSEVPVIEGMLFGAKAALSSFTLPLWIPAGSRLSMRVAAGVASRTLTWTVDYWGGSESVGSLPKRWVPYGLTSGQAYGTPVTSGAGTWSAWTSLTTDTTFAHDLWVPMVGSGTSTTFSSLNTRFQFAIASTADAATMVANGTGIIEHDTLTSNTSEAWGRYVATSGFDTGLADIYYAPRPAGSAVSGRVISTSGVANMVTLGVLGAVK